MKSIWWIKRDFRLCDNEALFRAVENSDAVLPVFVFEPEVLNSETGSPFHYYAQAWAVYDLRRKLQAKGSNVCIRTGNVVEVFSELKKIYDFEALFSHEETGESTTFQRDITVQNWCQKNQVEWHEFYQNGVIRRLKSRNDRTKIIEERFFATTVFKVPEDLKYPQDGSIDTELIPKPSEVFAKKILEKFKPDQLQRVSETQAHEDLKSFLLFRGKGYSGGISSPNSAFWHGSRLSVHLAWGTVSVRQVFAETFKKYEVLSDTSDPEVKQWRRSLKAFQARLYWRDHFCQRLESAPEMEFQVLNPAYADLSYENDPDKLQAWLDGKTGEPLVDACMRCLSTTGFLNFRMRAFIVSYAIFALHLSWRMIQGPLGKRFLDYEPGIHFSQIQMQAGIVGINTIRVYSPKKQMEDQDPRAVFIKKWIQELNDYTVAEIMEHEKVQFLDYPKPIVDFKVRTRFMKDQIFAIRKSEVGRAASLQVLDRHGSKKNHQARKRSLRESYKSKSKKSETSNLQMSLFT